MRCNPLLLILNPRAIPECMDSFDNLLVPRAYLTGYTERQLVKVIADLIDSTDYTHYVAVSDDVVVTRRAVQAVYEQLEDHPVVTGWCNLDDTDPRCSVVDRPLTGEWPTIHSYGFVHWSKVVTSPLPLIRTWFAGMCLTGMSREMWQRYPFSVLGDAPGCASDYSLCWRLQEDDVPIMAVREAACLHVRERWDVPDGEPRKRLLIGQVEANVRLVA